jgi:hypothetical protein
LKTGKGSLKLRHHNSAIWCPWLLLATHFHY